MPPAACRRPGLRREEESRREWARQQAEEASRKVLEEEKKKDADWRQAVAQARKEGGAALHLWHWVPWVMVLQVQEARPCNPEWAYPRLAPAYCELP